MDKNEIENLARKTFSLLNGVINYTPIQYLEIVERSRYLYEEFLKPCDIIAGNVDIDDGGPTILVFAIDRVMEYLEQKPKHMHSSFVVHIIAHELSHNNQSIDYYEYSHNHEYKMYVEECNNIYTYRFIENYMDWLKAKLNLKELYPISPFDTDSLMNAALTIVRKEEDLYRLKYPVYWTL